MFVDTSALMAILLEEPEADDFARQIEEAQQRFTSGIVVLEAVMRLSTVWRLDPGFVARTVHDALRQAKISILPIDDKVTDAAVTAFAAYGKGRHKARLNLGDCISYACAKVHDIPLLFKGDDFSQTDIVAA